MPCKILPSGRVAINTKPRMLLSCAIKKTVLKFNTNSAGMKVKSTLLYVITYPVIFNPFVMSFWVILFVVNLLTCWWGRARYGNQTVFYFKRPIPDFVKVAGFLLMTVINTVLFNKEASYLYSRWKCMVWFPEYKNKDYNQKVVDDLKRRYRLARLKSIT